MSDLVQLRREERKAWLEYCAACEVLEATPTTNAQAHAEAKRVHDRAKAEWSFRAKRHEQAVTKSETA